LKVYLKIARKFVKNESEDYFDCGDNLVCQKVPTREILFARWRYLLMYVNACEQVDRKKFWD